MSSLTLSVLGDSCRREIVKEIATHSGKWVHEVGRKWKRVEYARSDGKEKEEERRFVQF